VNRVPLRLRLTVVFSVAMALALFAGGLLLYGHMANSLDQGLNDGLRARVTDVSALISQADQGLAQSPANGLPGSSNGVAQVLDARGAIVDQSPGLPAGVPLLQADQLAQARSGPLIVPRAQVGGEWLRMLATPVSAQGRQLVIVVGAPLDVRDNALAELRQALLVGGPMALALVAFVGYLVAGAALRPVERMRARAALISANRPSERLPVPRSRDELGRLGETLNEMLGRLEVALEHERSFISNASHELRTPLTHLQAEVELALESPRSKAELLDALRAIGHDTDRLAQLAQDLLVLARVDHGALPVRLEATDLDDALRTVALRFERRAGDADRTIETDGAGLRWPVDRLRLEQAVANLIENALRHGAGPIRVVALRRGDLVELHVTDEGRGFPTDFLPRAFERFSRADESRGRGGAGLGLALVQALAAAHGGAASAANRPEGGADVWLSIPYVRTRPRSPSATGTESEALVPLHA
jgi:heavy metal sensor kinase